MKLKEVITTLMKEAEVINQYLCEIKNNLPLWIRLNRRELNEILDEIEDHIWEKAIENTENQNPNEIDLQIAISQIGNPKEIANKYTSRSTPRVFISKELYPYFLMYLKILFLACFFSLLFPSGYYSMIFGEVFIFLSFQFGIYLLTIYISLGSAILVIFFYLSTLGYLPYEARISRFYNRYSNSAYVQENSIKNPIDSRNLVIWAFVWLTGAIFSYLLSAITADPLTGPNPTGYFYCIFCSILFGIKLIRISFKEQFEILHRILIFIEFLLIYFLSVLYVLMDYRYQSVIQDFDLIVTILIILQILGFPIILITINYKIYQFFSLKNRYEQYQTFLSLRKRIIKKQSYVKLFKNDKSKSIETELGSNWDHLKDLNQYSHFEKDLILFIDKTRKKLPIWLKKSEKNAILNEINNEIRELVLDYQDDHQLTPERYNLIFNEVGDVDIIISELKQKGTPKLYISDELWLSYKGTFKAIVTYYTIIALFFMILMISFNSFSIDGLPIFIGFILGFFSIAFLTISAIFIILSITDYIPYNKKNQSESLLRVTFKGKTFFWRIAISVFFAFFGCIFILLSFFLVELTADFRIRSVVFLIGAMSLLFTGNELILLSLRKRFAKLNITLLTVNLILVLVLNFIIMYNAHAQLGFIRNVVVEFFLFLLFFLVNVEIFYSIFRIFQINIKINIK